MPATLVSRKPVNKITSADLKAFPIWEFATDEEGVEGMDETWVRPVKAKAIPSDAYSLSVAADFETASGRALGGLVGVTTAGGLEFSHGALLVEDQYLFVPANGYWRGDVARKALAKDLGMFEKQVFPLRFTLRVCIEQERTPRSGSFE